MSTAIERPQIFWLRDTLWNLYGDFKSQLFDGHGLRLDEWKRQERATLVKSGAGRTIYRVRLPELDLYVKHFRVTTAFNLVHQVFRQGRAEKEFHLARLLKESGISTIEPVALGERWRNGVLFESYLLSEAIPNGLTLYELIECFIRPGRLDFPPELRIQFAEQIGRLAATIHESGIEHRDLHEKNIIVQKQSSEQYRFFILDLHELKIHRPLNWEKAIKDLARMGRYFTLRTSTIDRYRFFRSYALARGIPMSQLRALSRDVEDQTMASRADFWRRRDIRPQRKNPRVTEYQAPGAKAYALQDIPEETVRKLMSDSEGPFRDSVVHWWKIGRGTRVAEVELPTIRRGQTLIYKQYLFKGWHESAAAVARENQATRSWKYGGSLLLRELPTPRPLVLIHRMRCGLPHTSYLLTERVPNSQTITQYLERHLRDLEPPESRHILLGVLEKAAKLLRKLHERGVSHRDLKASNVLASTGEDLADPDLWLIDLDGVQTWLEVPERHRVQNLARFYVSFHHRPWLTRTDCLRFLKLYLGRHFKRERWRSLWEQVRSHAERKIARNLRRGRSVV
ncbi:Lipopolysaccharide core heptose(I) kinase RfaP [Planctomycetes bacterium Pan216]|uniref:Lipopolysaccharide core heptose(I) kinase RfaP n=1 Tax=Kolteria novifilia TaxID=2527975 RepID=A0A518B6N1_9BACT|nr:Lipopolysaccharide core heptose(I) kinase RfaP [Planctomycetes bacterium Pan216]